MGKSIIQTCFSALLLTILISFQNTFAQDEISDSIEIYLIENFVTPEVPHTFMVSFFTSSPVKSSIIINGNIDYKVSDDYQENHEAEIDLTKFEFDDIYIPFVIVVEDSAGNIFQSENFDFEFPMETKIESESNFLFLCLFGGAVFGLPAPALVKWDNETYFSLTKEIPLIFIRSSGYAYPSGYFSLEYSHIFKGPVKNFFRVGYKHLIEIPGLEYVSPGINGFTNFKGFNGISPEVSLGLFRIFNTFTVYTRYRYNAKPGEAGSEFSEISLGLYSGFFAIYL
ncbi:MAG: hypothetical protein R6W90_08255 [Ignavibacteriaceae bacterium]